jgi:hypothetical protein
MSRTVREAVDAPDRMRVLHAEFIQRMIEEKLIPIEGIGLLEGIKQALLSRRY